MSPEGQNGASKKIEIDILGFKKIGKKLGVDNVAIYHCEKQNEKFPVFWPRKKNLDFSKNLES